MSYQRSIRVVLSRASKLLSFFGLNTDELNTSVRSLIRICYSLFILCYIIVQFLINFRNISVMNIKETLQNLYANVAIFFMFGSETFCAISSITVGLFHHRKKAKINAKLYEIEHLSSNFSSFDFSKFHHLHRIVRFVLFLLLCFFVFDAITLTIFQPQREYIIIILHYSARFICWTDMSYFLMILKILRLYFIVINHELIIMRENFQLNVTCYDYEFDKIKTIQRIHCALKKIFRLQNCLYKWQFCFALLHSASAVTSYAFFFVTRNLQGIISFAEFSLKLVTFNVYGVVWITMHFTLHIFMLKNISGTLEEGENTMFMLEKLRFEVNSEPVNQFLKYFSRQIFDDKIEFTACGFFTLDYTIIHQIISNSTMYLIILLQFHFSKVYFQINT